MIPTLQKKKEKGAQAGPPPTHPRRSSQGAVPADV